MSPGFVTNILVLDYKSRTLLVALSNSFGKRVEPISFSPSQFVKVVTRVENSLDIDLIGVSERP